MEPHFVFNALNTIAAFIRTEPEHARRLVLAFADHLRSRLARPGEFVTLEEELRHVRSYLDLEQARFGPQLEVTVDAEPDALPRPAAAAARAAARRERDQARQDRPAAAPARSRARPPRPPARDGARRRPRASPATRSSACSSRASASGTGLGLANVNRRLTAHYGEGVRLRSFPFGTVVRLEVPGRT